MNALLLAWTADRVVFVSAYALVTSWVDVVGVKLDVGNDELNVLVPLHVLLFDWTADSVVLVSICVCASDDKPEMNAKVVGVIVFVMKPLSAIIYIALKCFYTCYCLSRP